MSQLIPPDVSHELHGQPPQSDIHSSQSQSQTTLSTSAGTSQSRPDPNLDPNLSGDSLGPGPHVGVPSIAGASAPPGIQLGGLDSTQILTLLRHLPGVFNKLAEQGGLKDAAAEQLQQHLAGRPLPAPSSNFTFTTTPGPELPAPPAPPHQENGKGTKRKRGGKAPGSGDDVEGEDAEDWTRQRKDNHKEVERRRRGNINEGINELARIVPNGSGEKAKGAILNRAVQYIHHLKENEARNIEKWTLEKLLMDQAMGDLQAQLEDVRRMWDEERQAKDRALLELDVIRAGGGMPPPSHASSAHPNPYERRDVPRDRAYHPSDRHHHIQQSDTDAEERQRLVSQDPEVASRQMMTRDPDVAAVGDGGSVDPEADAEGEGDAGEGDTGEDGRSGKKMRVD